MLFYLFIFIYLNFASSRNKVSETLSATTEKTIQVTEGNRKFHLHGTKT